MSNAKYANLSEYQAKYKKYFDVFEAKSAKAKAGLAVNHDDLVGLGEQLAKFENWKEFKEANGSSDDLGVVPRIGLDVIAAAASVSAIPLLAAVQPIEERKGLVYYKNVTARTTRGSVTSGDTLISGERGRVETTTGFGSEKILGEVLGAGDGSAVTFNVVIAYAPVRTRTVEIVVDGQDDTLLIDDGKGRLIGVGGQGTINYESGVASVTFAEAPADGAEIKATYSTNFEAIDEIPTIDSEYESKEVTAQFFALRSEIGLTEIAA